jgi:hypothetical protein
MTRRNLLKLQHGTASELENELTVISVFSSSFFLTEVFRRHDLFAGPHSSRTQYYEQSRGQQRWMTVPAVNTATRHSLWAVLVFSMPET